jgi:uncharacterized protein
MLELSTIVGLAVLGAIIGVLVGMTSVGSGALLTPILTLDYGNFISKAVVVGVSSTEGTITKFVASFRNYIKKSLNGGYALMIAITGVPLAVVGAFFTGTIVTWNLFNPILAVVLVIAALSIIINFKFMDKKKINTDPKMTWNLRVRGMIVGVVVGFIAGMTGVSTGSLLVSLLIIALGFPPRTAVTIAVFEGGIILLAAALAQIYLGHINWLFTGLLILGGIPGILIGSHFKDKINQRLLGYGVAGVIIFESARTLSQFFFGKSFFFV